MSVLKGPCVVSGGTLARGRVGAAPRRYVRKVALRGPQTGWVWAGRGSEASEALALLSLCGPKQHKGWGVRGRAGGASRVGEQKQVCCRGWGGLGLRSRELGLKARQQTPQGRA